MTAHAQLMTSSSIFKMAFFGSWVTLAPDDMMAAILWTKILCAGWPPWC